MTVSFYTQIALGLDNLIADLSLSGTPQVGLWKFPTDRPAAGVSLPCIQITTANVPERCVGSLNGSVDWEYPLLISALAAGNQDFGWDQTWMTWRRQVEDALHNQRPLAGSVSTNPLLRVEPRAVVDAGMLHDANLKIGQLLVWARNREGRPTPPGGNVLAGGDIIYTSVGQGLQAAVQTLGLAGIASSQVLLRQVWSDRLSVSVDLETGPAIIVAASAEAERELGPGVGRDDWSYPTVVTLLRESNQSVAWDDTWFLWRQQVRDAFHLQRLAAVPSVLYCEVEPRAMFDAAAWHEQNIDVGQLAVRCRARNART